MGLYDLIRRKKKYKTTTSGVFKAEPVEKKKPGSLTVTHGPMEEIKPKPVIPKQPAGAVPLPPLGEGAGDRPRVTFQPGAVTPEGAPDARVQKMNKGGLSAFIERAGKFMSDPRTTKTLGQVGMALSKPGSPGQTVGAAAVGMAEQEAYKKTVQALLGGSALADIPESKALTPTQLTTAVDMVTKTETARFARVDAIMKRINDAQKLGLDTSDLERRWMETMDEAVLERKKFGLEEKRAGTYQQFADVAEARAEKIETPEERLGRATDVANIYAASRKEVARLGEDKAKVPQYATVERLLSTDAWARTKLKFAEGLFWNEATGELDYKFGVPEGALEYYEKLLSEGRQHEIEEGRLPSGWRMESGEGEDELEDYVFDDLTGDLVRKRR